MLIASTVPAARETLALWRAAGERVAFVPTMGKLHDGHLSVLSHAARQGGRTVVSIFVNPLQFTPGEDFLSYPRDFAADIAKLTAAGAHLLFAPDLAQMYPDGMDTHTVVEVPGLSDILCGAARPGHFRGVTTVVTKLFNIVQPAVALFGEKDFQQLQIIRRMVAELCMPVTIVGVPTVREADGLAMSSRNEYLSPDERQLAPLLYEGLCAAAERINRGERDFACIETSVINSLRQAGFSPEYCSVRRDPDLGVPDADAQKLIILAAARLGRARLIDNIRVALMAGI